jgi:hypothetical protein
MAKNGPPTTLRRGYGPKAALEQGIPPALIIRDDQESVRRINEATRKRKEIEQAAAPFRGDRRLRKFIEELKAATPPLSAADFLRCLKIRADELKRKDEVIRKSKL